MTTISIRKANLDDLETLLEFEQGVIKAERPMDSFLGDGTLSYYNIPELITAKKQPFNSCCCKQRISGFWVSKNRRL